jgi:hypothetical protein
MANQATRKTVTPLMVARMEGFIEASLALSGEGLGRRLTRKSWGITIFSVGIGRDHIQCDAEGATAPETLRQKDRYRANL